jgi:hypothetical protein
MKIYKKDSQNLINSVNLLKVVNGLYRMIVVLNHKRYECRHVSKDDLAFIMITHYTQDGDIQNAYVSVNDENYYPVAVNPDKYTIDIFFEHKNRNLEDYEHIDFIGD